MARVIQAPVQRSPHRPERHPVAAENDRVEGRQLQLLAGFEGAGGDATLNRDAQRLVMREQLSGCDALVTEATIRSRCTILYSEDFGPGAGSLVWRW